jgi:hypothetical protein
MFFFTSILSSLNYTNTLCEFVMLKIIILSFEKILF